jgi:hypothetical protein
MSAKQAHEQLTQFGLHTDITSFVSDEQPPQWKLLWPIFGCVMLGLKKVLYEFQNGRNHCRNCHYKKYCASKKDDGKKALKKASPTFIGVFNRENLTANRAYRIPPSYGKVFKLISTTPAVHIVH